MPDCTFKGVSNYFSKLEFLREFNLMEYNNWTRNQISSWKFFFIWYYLKALLHKDNLILLFLVPQAFYRAFRTCRKDGLFRWRQWKLRLLKWRFLFFLRSYVFCKGTVIRERNLLPTGLCQFPTVKPWCLKTRIANIFIEKKFYCSIGYTQRTTLFFLKNIFFLSFLT